MKGLLAWLALACPLAAQSGQTVLPLLRQPQINWTDQMRGIDRAQLTPAPAKLAKGQTPDQVEALLGPANSRSGDPSLGTFVWYYWHPHNDLRVGFENGRVSSIKFVQLKLPGMGPSRFERIITGVAVAGAEVYVIDTCYQVRQKPVLLMTIADWEWLEVCQGRGY